jgi:alpha-galactosidase
VLNSLEERFHFSLWAINKSPLTIGAPMTSATSKDSLAILSNKEIIALNQDPLGQQANLVRRYTEESYDIWAGNLSSNGMVVAVTNWANSAASVKIDLLNSVGIANATQVRDVWNAKDLGPVTDSNSTSIALQLQGHEARILVLSGVQLTTPPSKSRGSSYYAAASAKLSGQAGVVDCSSQSHYCLPTKKKVGNMYPGSSILFQGVNITQSGATKVVGVDFINYDVALGSAWSNGTNTRNLTISVNGGKAKRWAFPISGGNWYETGRLEVELSGFNVGNSNQILLSSPGTDPSPDVVGLEVYS